MSNMQRARQFARDVVREAAQRLRSEQDEDQHLRGFSKAAGISLRHIDDRLAVLKEQMKSSSLSKADQAIYFYLDALKSEIVEDYDGYWQGVGRQWRSPKPVSRLASRTEESPPEE